jgi:FkbM family methyltransferase
LDDDRKPDADGFVARCFGVGVPPSPFLTPRRIERIAAGRYEGQEIAGALHLVRPGDRVLELGAGLGIVGAVTALNRAPERLLAFEANPDLIPHIRRLYAANGLQARMEVRNRILVGGEAPPTMPFHLAGSFLGSSLIERPRGRTVEVETLPWAAVIAELRPTVLLIDIEGGELDLLERAGLAGIRAIVIEFHPKVYGRPGMQHCQALLRRQGFAPVAEKSTAHVWAAERAA